MAQTSNRPNFTDFYRDHYLAEHRNFANIALHVLGMLGGVALLFASVTMIPLAWALAFPLVHVLPGLLGHRLFERNPDVGDARLTRTDFPLHWFLIANHWLVLRLVTTGRR